MPKTNGKILKCDICKKEKADVKNLPDPFSAEINHDFTPRPLCDDCRGMRREEV